MFSLPGDNPPSPGEERGLGLALEEQREGWAWLWRGREGAGPGSRGAERGLGLALEGQRGGWAVMELLYLCCTKEDLKGGVPKAFRRSLDSRYIWLSLWFFYGSSMI